MPSKHMTVEAYNFGISPYVAEVTANLIKKGDYFVPDIVDSDMRCCHPLLHRFIEHQSLAIPDYRHVYKSGAGVGYCLFANPLIHINSSTEITQGDIALLEEDRKYYKGRTEAVAETIVGRSPYILGLAEMLIDMSPESAGSEDRKYFMRGMGDATLPFISKLTAEAYVRKHKVLQYNPLERVTLFLRTHFGRVDF